MFAWLAKKQFAAFERRWRYDTAYLRELVEEAGVGALMPMRALQQIGAYRRDVPVDVYYAAKLVAAKAADCGPCLQLAVRMAEDAGVPAATISSVLRDDDAALTSDVRLGVELARATIARDAGGEAARAEILRRWGRRALVSLAYGMVASQAYPTIKYALGYGHACVRVRVGSEDLALRETAPA